MKTITTEERIELLPDGELKTVLREFEYLAQRLETEDWKSQILRDTAAYRIRAAIKRLIPRSHEVCSDSCGCTFTIVSLADLEAQREGNR